MYWNANRCHFGGSTIHKRYAQFLFRYFYLNKINLFGDNKRKEKKSFLHND